MSAPARDAALGEVLGAVAWTRAGEHPEVEVLFEYSTGSLAPEVEARVNDHLVACRECAATLLDLEPLTRPGAARDDGVADLAAEAAWRELRNRAFADEGRLRPAARRWQIAVAASLVAALGASLWAVRLQQAAGELRQELAELSRPLVNMPVSYVAETTRSGGEGAIGEEETIEVAAEASHFLLIFTPAALDTYAEYEVRFADLEDREVLRVGGLVLSESGGLRLGLPRGALPAGDYRVRLSGFDDGAWQPLEEHRRRLVYLERP